ncbi:MAG: efflux transporter outer membrane subunit [Burkholderiaceae bacterium]|nr:efflux transporter outer membrane subunit [Burkholderiaceae bacterium]
MGLGMAGCATMVPSHELPALPVPDRFDEAGAAPSAAPAAAIDWPDYFADPRLRSLVEQALTNNRELRAALLRVEEARAAYGIQHADRLPTIGVAFDSVRARVPGDLNVTGRPVLGNQFQLGVGLSSWELDLWGRVRSLTDAALQSYLATDAARRAVTLSVIAQVANGYLGLRELDERLVLARRTAASREESRRIFRRRVEMGATSKLELTQVELLSLQASALVAQLEQARAIQVHALTLLVGATADLSPTVERLDAHVMFRPLDPGIPSELLLNRPDIVAAEHELRRANANLGAARAAFFPRIALTGSFGTASAELDGLFGTGSSAWTFAPSISLPIFDGGRRAAALDLAEVRHEQAVVRYEQAVQAAFRDVADALSARRWFGEQVKILRDTLAVQTERARLAKLRYDSGAARYLEVLDAERDLLGAEQQLVQTQRAWLAAQVTLYATLGGGSQHIGPSAPRTNRPIPSRMGPARTGSEK